MDSPSNIVLFPKIRGVSLVPFYICLPIICPAPVYLKVVREGHRLMYLLDSWFNEGLHLLHLLTASSKAQKTYNEKGSRCEDQKRLVCVW